VAALVAGALVSLFSIDLGPIAKARAEREATTYLERPMHIGKLRALLRPGEFELDDIVIEGLTANARPFLTAKRLTVRVPWWTILRHQLFVEVRMTDWHMVIETWANGRHSMPKLVPKTARRKSSLITTVSFVYADRGEFTYDDHATPWSVVARNLNVDLARASNLASYVGTARFSNGTVQIQNFLPMRTDLSTRFTLDGSIVHLRRIDLRTDGTQSQVSGDVDFGHWPEQRYVVDSRVVFQKMREIFFAHESWALAGEGHFTGVFHLFQGGRELKGDFTSELAGVNALRFPHLYGSLDWLPASFAVTHAGSDFYDGQATFDYGLAPLGTPQGSIATFHAHYDGVDLETVGRAFAWEPLLLAGRAVGQMSMQWPNGRFHDVSGTGDLVVTPPAGVTLAAATLSAVAAPPATGPLTRPAPSVAVSGAPPAPDATRPLAVGGQVTYRFNADGLDFADSWAASEATRVTFHGRTAYLDGGTLPFHVTSADWQESDRLLAAILTKFSTPTSPVEVGGRGTFDGVMTKSFRQPHIEGAFAGESVRAWGVRWGRATGDLAIENNFVRITHGLVGDTAAATIHADGLFYLGFRKDRGEEMNATFHVAGWPLTDFKTAFNLADWPVDGTGSADLVLNGPYKGLVGSGHLTIAHGSAWHETFDTATAALQFEGTGLRLSGVEMTKGPGVATGALWIGWDGTYSFDADGDHVPVESLTSVTVPRAPLSGTLRFQATGAGSFAAPAYSVGGRVADLFAGDEGIGDVSGHLTVRNRVVTIDSLEAASGRLQVSGSGRIALNAASDIEMALRFTGTSIDPYLRFVAPTMSPYTRAIVSGSIRVAGALATPEQLLIDTTIDDAKLTLFDYDLQNDGPVHVVFEQDVIKVERLKLKGTGTNLDLHGEIPLANAPLSLTATGEANLAVLQAFGPLKDLQAAGSAVLSATIAGDVHNPVFRGTATIQDGKIRPAALPQSLEQINGRVTFDASGINVGELRARMGNGNVVFGGSISLKGIAPDEFNVTMKGDSMRVRYPEGFSSTVDADLALTGPVSTPLLSGRIDVLRATYTRQLEADVSLLGLAAGGANPIGPAPPAVTGFPLTFDIQIKADQTLHIDNQNAHVTGSADLTYRGTVDKPSLTGRVDIDSAVVFFGGNRYTVRNGTIDFSNPTKIEPLFDVVAETRVRVPGDTYVVSIHLTGTTSNLRVSATSDPPLPVYDIFSLVFGQVPDVGTSTLRSIGPQQQAQQQLLRTAGAELLASPISSRVGSVFEKTIPIDTVQITPLLGSLLGNEPGLQQLNPTARVTLGKRISPRAYLTYSRDVSAAQNEVIVLEYDQSDRVSWVLSRNENHTYALDFRIRHVF
jgi:hypothetical protein